MIEWVDPCEDCQGGDCDGCMDEIAAMVWEGVEGDGADRCVSCGEVLIDDMEVGQGYCAIAPCWMWATGQIELAREWERENRSGLTRVTSMEHKS